MTDHEWEEITTKIGSLWPTQAAKMTDAQAAQWRARLIAHPQHAVITALNECFARKGRYLPDLSDVLKACRDQNPKAAGEQSGPTPHECRFARLMRTSPLPHQDLKAMTPLELEAEEERLILNRAEGIYQPGSPALAHQRKKYQTLLDRIEAQRQSPEEIPS